VHFGRVSSHFSDNELSTVGEGEIVSLIGPNGRRQDHGVQPVVTRISSGPDPNGAVSLSWNGAEWN